MFLELNFPSPRKVISCLEKYALNIFQDSGLTSAHPGKLPVEHILKLTPTDGALLNDPTKYIRLIGRMIYLIVTRPNIVYLVHTLSQFMHEPTTKYEVFSDHQIWLIYMKVW